ncbi:MAG: hypothetical protein AAGH15_12370 [Myxococcota bacterium]
MKRVLWLVALAACATLGDETAFPGELSTTGVGPFRSADEAETGQPAGRVLDAGDDAVGRVMVAGEFLFAAVATPLDDPPARDMALEPSALDPAQLGPLRIERAARTAPTFGFAGREVVLEADRAWEGEDLRDPWVMVLPDGRARLYYVGGPGDAPALGVAEAAGPGGAFTKLGDAPILMDVRSPTVVRAPAGAAEPGFRCYFERDGTIVEARSSDGLSFEESPAPLALPPDGAEPAEEAVGQPGALLATTPAGREVLRLYFQSRRADGLRVLALAASLDGEVFERPELPVLELPRADVVAHPAPVLDDAGPAAGITRLHHTVRRREGDLELREARLATTPERLLPAE